MPLVTWLFYRNQSVLSNKQNNNQIINFLRRLFDYLVRLAKEANYIFVVLTK